jgi:hypothetical protein
MVETAKGYMSDDGVEFTSYLECQVHEEYAKRGLAGYGHDPNERCRFKPSDSCFYFHDTYDPVEWLYRR